MSGEASPRVPCLHNLVRWRGANPRRAAVAGRRQGLVEWIFEGEGKAMDGERDLFYNRAPLDGGRNTSRPAERRRGFAQPIRQYTAIGTSKVSLTPGKASAGLVTSQAGT
jgi:hypothetical protein